MANSSTIVCFMIISCLIKNTMSSTNQTDLLSLLAFKAAINSDPLGSLNSWNQTAAHFCSWEGIQCASKHPERVFGINLQSRGLAGSISPHIGNLSFLRTIILQHNAFHGPIPQEIGRLRRLKHVEFSNNSFSGSIPRNLSQCSNLLYLNLIDNNLSGVIPPELGSLHKLENLGLGVSELSGPIPQSIGNLTSLIQLSLTAGGLKGEIPESLAELQRLRYLLLFENNLTGSIPSGLFNISTIIIFAVAANDLKGSIPSTIGLTLPNLRILVVGGNKFSGRIPLSLSNATSLEVLSLADNLFTGPLPMFGGLSQLQILYAGSNSIEDDISSLVSSLTNCTNLHAIGLGGNLLHGQIPNTVANLSIHLSTLIIGYTQIHGKIPSEIQNLVGLNFLNLQNNNLEGPIPVGIGKLTSLQTLYLDTNRLTNELPSSLGNLSLLINLDLSTNNLTGFIPTSLAYCTKLLSLDLSLNNLNGPIPPEIMNLSSISIRLALAYNALTGSIPFEIGSLKNLAYLDMAYNMLSGSIPNSLSSCISLEQLYLMDNLLQGQIPHEMSVMKGLQILDLSRNNLSGTIPPSLGELRFKNLNLSFNRLQGELPMLGVFRNTTVIYIQGNKDLCGGISELNLPPCASSKTGKKNNSSTLLKIVIPTATVSVLLCLAIFLYNRKAPKNNSPLLPTFFETHFLRLSYADLLKATAGFAESHLLGAGTFGSVFKGVLDDGRTLIAVKVLNLVVKGASKSFMAECKALRSIKHRNLVKILSACESIDFQGNDFKALIYEFKANGSLEKWLHHNGEREERDAQVTNLNMIQRVNVAIDIAQALEYLHWGTDSTIVHGDLKPGNILLDLDMSACVGDFGLAKIISIILPPQEGASSSTIGIKGTIGYVPPEYGTTESISTAGDVYSFGILILEMFTNKRPTDDLFKDHVTLHNFVSAALPDHVMEIVDPYMFQMEPGMNNSKVKDCMASILRIGVSCSREIPRDRLSMIDVVIELHKIKSYYLV